jgi:hypothetical protein
MSLFHPATGKVGVKGVRSCTNVVLHPWLKHELEAILRAMPAPQKLLSPEENRLV